MKTTREELVTETRRLASMIYSRALRTTRNDADSEDICQEVFRKVWNKAQTYDPTRSKKNWILTIADNQIRDYLRRKAKNREKVSLQSDEAQQYVDAKQAKPFEGTLAEERNSRITREVSLLSKALRNPVRMHYIEGLSYEEISSSLNIPTGTIKSRLFSARAILRKSLADLMAA